MYPRGLPFRPGPPTVRSYRLICLASFVLVAGCIPTISEPRSPEHVQSLAEGERNMGHGRYEEAAESFAEAAEQAERRVDLDEALYRQTRALIQLERYDEAIAILQQVADRRPVSRRTSRAMFEIALIRLDHLHQDAQAMQDFERVMRETPDDGLGSRALYYVLRDYESKADTAGAIAFCDRMQADLGNSTLGDDLLRSKASLQLLTGDRDGARASLEEIVQRYPYPYGQRWDDAIVTLAEMDVEDGQPERAIERLEALVHRNEETNLVGSYTLPSMPRAQMRIAEIYRDELHDRERASDAYDRLLRRFPRSILRDDALYQAGIMWLDGGDTRRGCHYLQRVVDEFEVGHARRMATERIAADCQNP